jgi:hypothetical protein
VIIVTIDWYSTGTTAAVERLAGEQKERRRESA